MGNANRILVGGAIALFLLASCSTTPAVEDMPAPAAVESPDSVESDSTESAEMSQSSRITAVEVTSSGEGYSFAVTVESDETGCDQYADWWEVVTPEGELLYRRILAHSHVDEQPFTRSGGPVAIGEEDVVVVRSHVNPDGYSTQAMQGSASEGFSPTLLEDGFAAELEESEPQPSGCSF